MKDLMVNQSTILIDDENAKRLKTDFDEQGVEYTIYEHPDEYVQDYLAQLYISGYVGGKQMNEESTKQAILDNYEKFREDVITPYWEMSNPLDDYYTDKALHYIESIPDELTRNTLGVWNKK